MIDLPQLLVAGVTNGAVYALVALALALPFAASHVMNFAVGELLMVGAMLSFLTIEVWGQPGWLAVVEILAVAWCLGAASFEVVVRPVVRRAGPLTATFALLGVSAVLISGTQLGISHNLESVTPLLGGEPLRVAGAGMFPQAALLVAVAVALGVGAELVLRRTRYGRASRAVAQDVDAAEVMGIDVRRLLRHTFALSSVIAAAGGVLLSGLVASTATMGGGFVLKGLLAVMIGGAFSPGGAMLGGLVVGLAESILTPVLPSGLNEAVGFVLLLVVLALRPSGLFARVPLERVG